VKDDNGRDNFNKINQSFVRDNISINSLSESMNFSRNNNKF
jgi:hypothetical protein